MRLTLPHALLSGQSNRTNLTVGQSFGAAGVAGTIAAAPGFDGRFAAFSVDGTCRIVTLLDDSHVRGAAIIGILWFW
jgi:hypothetical protein